MWVARNEPCKVDDPRVISNTMMAMHETDTNRKKVRQLNTVLAKLLAEVLQRGFYGTATIDVSVQDGTIQNLRRRVESIDK